MSARPARGARTARSRYELRMRFFRDDRFPLVVAKAPSGRDATRDIPAFYEEWDAIIARGPHVVLLDLRAVDANTLGAAHRKQIAQAAEKRRRGFERTLVAEARLCSGPVVRAMMTAFDWLLKQPFQHPIANFSSTGAAEQWLEAELARRGLVAQSA